MYATGRGWRSRLVMTLGAAAIVMIAAAAFRHPIEGNGAEASTNPRPADQSRTTSEGEAAVPFFFERGTPLAEAVRLLKERGYKNVNEGGRCGTAQHHGGRWIETNCDFMNGPQGRVLMTAGRRHGAKGEPILSVIGVFLLAKPGTWSTLSDKLAIRYGPPESPHPNILAWKRSGCELGASLTKANESHEWINIDWLDWCADPFDQQDERIRARCGR